MFTPTLGQDRLCIIDLKLYRDYSIEIGSCGSNVAVNGSSLRHGRALGGGAHVASHLPMRSLRQ